MFFDQLIYLFVCVCFTILISVLFFIAPFHRRQHSCCAISKWRKWLSEYLFSYLVSI